MIDFKKKLKKTKIVKKIDPVEIYESLDRRSEAGPLRPSQEIILNKWYSSKREEKDVIIKLHTGEGKTLIGLLILQSKLNSGDGPCIYICPNKYLVGQVCLDASKFGINYCTIDGNNDIPNDFLDGERILITHVHKVFNGKTIFGFGNSAQKVGTVILDDSHACIDSIRNSFTIKAGNKHGLYKELFELFENDLKEQGEGTSLEISNGDYNSFLPIPYWAWIDKADEVMSVFSRYLDTDEVKFCWPIIKNDLLDCQVFISGGAIEISPINTPIDKFTSFSKASQRILMSATTQDDAFFIKGLGFNADSVKSPLNIPEQKWSGEKMILIPSMIADNLDRELIVTNFAKPSEKNYGVVSLVTSFKKATVYKELGSKVPESTDIINAVRHLKMKNYNNTYVFVNRYDGIDLPDENCRVLIIDSKPFLGSLEDRYEELNRENSEAINIKVAQKIEQGLGRSVRGTKDYCLILLIGADLVKFIRSSQTRKFFSPQTRKQIEIGLELAKMASEEINNDEGRSFDVVKSLMKQSLKRDEGWKEYYKEEMELIEESLNSNNIYDVLKLERKAIDNYKIGNAEDAINSIQIIIDKYCGDESEKAWYLQIMARYKYNDSKVDSNKLQIAAFQKNRDLLKPKTGVVYKKLEYINENRVKRIKDWLLRFSSFEDLMLSVDSTLNDLQFGVSADKFERALKELGIMLGFLSERPDKEYKKGPDNLWCGVGNQYFMFECKSEVNGDRIEINKHEAAQMDSHCGWFEKQYKEASVKRIMIIPTVKLSYHGDFTHDVEIMRKGKLKNLKKCVKGFFKEFKTYELGSVTNETMQQFIDTHKLDVDSLKKEFSEKPRISYKVN